MSVTIVQQTWEEKVAMYMKLSKRELAQMLANRDQHEQYQSTIKIEHQPSNPAWPPNSPLPGTIWCQASHQ